MNLSQIAAFRLHNQQLAETTLHTASDVIAWLGAVQAQEYAHAKWALGLRAQGVTDAAIEQAFFDGSILRTHVMRPTWHFVTPADIRWLLGLTAPRVHAANAYMYRKLELDDALFLRSDAAIANALERGSQLTRSELGAALQQAGIVADGFRLSYLMMHAELNAIVCSGARRGKQFTYALLDQRVPHARLLERDEALAELTKRYFASHGPALMQDFVWWSGLTVADAHAGRAMANLVHEVINGKTYWYAASALVPQHRSPTALLLPMYDEYTVAYKDHRAILDPMYAQPARTATFGGVMVIDGQVIGNWRRTFSRGAVVIDTAPFRPLTAAETDAFTSAAQRYAEFLAMPVVVR